MILTQTAGQNDLPRYFARCFEAARTLKHGRLDIRLPDGRVFRAEGSAPGPVAEVVVHDPDLFTRMVREGYLGFCEAYLEGDWSTPDLQAFMDLVNAGNDEMYNSYPGQSIVQLYEKLRLLLVAAQHTPAGAPQYQPSL